MEEITRFPSSRRMSKNRLVQGHDINDVRQAIASQVPFRFSVSDRMYMPPQVLCKLEQDGGGDGALNFKPSYTYTCRDIIDTNIIYMVNATPLWAREKGRFEPAKWGWFTFLPVDADHPDGALISCDEAERTGNC